jgi:hypothetical protein
MAGAKTAPQLVDNGLWIGVPLLIQASGDRLALPVGALEEVHEVDSYCLFGLPNLPIRTPSVALELFTEPSGAVRKRLIRGGTLEKPPNPTNAMWRRLLLHQSRPQQELAELLQRALPFPHDVSRFAESTAPSAHRAQVHRQ